MKQLNVNFFVICHFKEKRNSLKIDQLIAKEFSLKNVKEKQVESNMVKEKT